MKESNVVSNMMEDFPPICMKDPLEVRVSFEGEKNTRMWG